MKSTVEVSRGQGRGLLSSPLDRVGQCDTLYYSLIHYAVYTVVYREFSINDGLVNHNNVAVCWAMCLHYRAIHSFTGTNISLFP